MAYTFDPNSPMNFGIFSTATGSGATTTPNRTVMLAFEQYEIVLAVTEDNRVLGVVEVREKKDFRNVKQKASSTGYFDMERFVRE
jgi:hypothetical protein